MSEEESLLTIPATISKVTALQNRALKCVIETQEGIDDEVMAKILNSYDRLGYFCFLPGEKMIEAEQVAELPEIKRDETEAKTPSQRLRSRLFVYFKETHADIGGFNDWYAKTLESIGQQFLDKLDEK